MTKPVLVISGGSRGIGEAIASLFLESGYVVCNVSRTASGFKEVHSYTVDVGMTAQVEAACQEIANRYEKIHVLIANAGMCEPEINPVLGDDPFDAVLRTNLYGTYDLIRFARPWMHRGSSVITMGSVLSKCGVADQPAYCAAKHAVLGLTRAMALKEAKNGITFNCVCPGWVDTSMASKRASALKTSVAGLAASIPTGVMTSPADIAAFCLYLASPSASNITGQSFTLDGGSTCF